MRKEPARTVPDVPAELIRHAGGRRRASSGAAVGSFLLFLALALGSVPAGAQTIPRLQAFGGYSFMRFDSRTFGFADKSNLDGWNASLAFNVLPYLGAVGEISGQYASQVNFRDVAFGPQILYPRWKLLFFGHGLFGKGRTFDSIGTGRGDTERAYLFGGGVDMDIPHHSQFAARIQADYIHSNLFSSTQNNVRVSVGLVYHWHSFRRRHRVPSAP